MIRSSRLALALAIALATPVASFAQSSAPTPGAAAPTSSDIRPGARRAPSAARTNREPTAGQMAARDRQKRCGVEWREAKATGKTGGLKWPQYWKQCNARLKGSHV